MNIQHDIVNVTDFILLLLSAGEIPEATFLSVTESHRTGNDVDVVLGVSPACPAVRQRELETAVNCHLTAISASVHLDVVETNKTNLEATLEHASAETARGLVQATEDQGPLRAGWMPPHGTHPPIDYAALIQHERRRAALRKRVA